MQTVDEIQAYHEITGLIYYKRPLYVTTIKSLLLLNSVTFAKVAGADFGHLANEAKAKGDSACALEMSVVQAQLEHWAEHREGVTSLIPYFGIRQLLRDFVVVDRGNLEAYVQRVLVLSRVRGFPELPQFLLIVDDEPALFVTEDNSIIADCAGEIGGGVIRQDELTKRVGKLMR